MDKRLTIEKRIEAELMSYDGTMGIYADDLHLSLIHIFVKFIILIHKIIFHKEYGSVAKSGAMR